MKTHTSEIEDKDELQKCEEDLQKLLFDRSVSYFLKSLTKQVLFDNYINVECKCYMVGNVKSCIAPIFSTAVWNNQAEF